ncbi:hypothetical protein E4631_14520 [Hymenobacter sp. UV11]|uniref:DUF5691 domain-containing protein n=1 Tax=Hymenobacter sp. UV11 TaxID=1849735 RepID=UPI0010617CED|nr:DUF5691 domain-containing protein [Hymenobacter sp. UV11]TDN39463.1 hypothetical protein A8B98_19695 [Hymenobacter sp. UV11]TFZ65445.1 hypothetical protein E4631_14520 [Hymenobacter sp. UV11]
MISYTEDQATALVPDAGTLQRGRELAAPAKWAGLGRTDTAAWGECAGSGTKPYLTGIDLTAPAFKCSCPSRVFPCKHGAGLLLLLAQQPELLPPAAPPTWLAEWLDKRQTKQEEQAAKPTVAPASDAVADSAAPDKARLKREAQRQARMAAGAEELETWLLDLLRTGLADLPSRPRSFWETPAARLVDNQLPGLAAVLRELAAYPSTGPDWASRLLGQLGELYLLLRAWANRAALPPAAQLEIAQQVGVTLKKDELLADPTALAVADTWLVLGQHTWPEDRLMARRSWLHGQHSGRRALVLEFAFGSQPFATALLPQERYAGELIFYPGLLPLRAVASAGLVRQPAAPGRRPTPRSLAAMLDAYATALARQPWLREFPASVWAVVGRGAAGAWQLHDPESGAALPLRLPSERRGWHLLARSGGQPLALFGEWDGREFRVLSYWLTTAEEGAELPMAPAPAVAGPTPAATSQVAPPPPPPPATNPWPALLRVALLGTRQAPEALPDLNLGEFPAAATREQQLLSDAGTLALMQKAGFQLLNNALPPAAPPEAQPLLGPTGHALLRQLLSRPHYRPLLSHYLQQIAQHQRIIPPALLVEVLSWLKDQTWAAPLLEGALGARGQWLAAQNPDWFFAVDTAAQHAPTEADWHTDPHPRRQLFLEKLLLTDPAHAARLLADALPQEAAATQVALLDALDTLPLAPPLPADFAPTLAPLLASRSKEVRQITARWLARVADSPLLPRLWARAEPLLQVKRKLLGRAKLTITLPTAWAAEWQRDGIEQKTADYAGGEKAGQLGQLLALLPPGRWAAAWGVRATEAVALAAASDWAVVLLPAWLRAAHLHHDADFALALLLHEASQPSLPPKSRLVVEASRVLSPDQTITWLLAALPASAATLPASSAWAHWLPRAGQPWPAALRQRALPLLRAALRQPPSWAPEQTERDAAVRNLLLSLGASPDPELLLPLTAALGDPADWEPRFADEVAQTLELLALRPQLAASLT